MNLNFLSRGFGLAIICFGYLASAEASPSEVNVGGAEFGSYQVGQGGKSFPTFTNQVSRAILSVAGNWTVALDPKNLGLKERWQTKQLIGEPITLPGTLDDAGIGDEPSPSRTVLTRRKEYIGPAWYQSDVVIPESWAGKRVSLFLERVMWESRTWLDGQLIGSQDSLDTPQIHDFGDRLTPGKHLLTVRIDNCQRPGASSHSYGSNIQIRWNGMVGRLELIARDPLSVATLQVYPELEKRRIRAEATIANETGVTVEGQVTFRVFPHGQSNGVPVAEVSAAFKGSGSTIRVERLVDMGKDMKTWDDFHPALYDLVATVRGNAEGKILADPFQTVFGMREFGVKESHFTLNGRKIFLRGTHDAGAVPLTGRPPMTVDEWRKIFRTCKDYGLNHVRYHSFCPPEEAFMAADEEGILIQAELPFWGNVKPDWAGTPYLRQEMERILNDYGNHPSFVLMSMGNEHSGDWDTLADFVDHGKRTDPRHCYTSTSNAYKREGVSWVPGDEFSTIMWGAPTNGQRHVVRYMERFQEHDEPVARDLDWREVLNGYTAPVISHELGQWWIYPDFAEIKKYTGVMRPTTLEAQRETAEKGGTIALDQAFHRASGALAVELYKEDIERQLRTPGMAGFQLLDLHDYSGQGSALVGMLDAFWESKGLVSPADYRRFCDSTVMLARIPKVEYVSGESLQVSLEVAHYGQTPLSQVAAEWKLLRVDGSVMANGKLPAQDVATGDNTVLGKINYPLTGERAERLTLEAGIPGVGQANRWHIWVYPRQSAITPAMEKVRVSRTLDAATLAFVENGGKLLLVADRSDQTTPIYFPTPAWLPTYGIDTCGALIDDHHPALAAFPTESHSDWQWFSLLHDARGLMINDSMPSPTPIVQAIDSPFWRGSPILLVGTCTVGNGKVVVTSLNLIDDLETQPAILQLRYSLQSWLASTTERPAVALEGAQLKMLLEGGRFRTITQLPTKTNIVLDVNCAARASKDGIQPWQPTLDEVPVAMPGFGYSLVARARTWMPPQNVWRKGDQHGWNMPTILIPLQVPKNFSGTLYLYFQDADTGGKRDGLVYACGGTIMVGRHDGAGRWLALDISAKDSAEGQVDVLVHKRSFREAPLLHRMILSSNQVK